MSAKDNDKKAIRILSFDNGGPGTYSQLLIVKEYMARIAHDFEVDECDVYPADYFDLMGGVGFGGHVLFERVLIKSHSFLDSLLYYLAVSGWMWTKQSRPC
ncbi:hypothetical protein M408DRAFT_104234 [Serendipita vermifera MAFF 305830]|uniref:Uncharacterized protein n=1 Tax=Serendipita vermifera MAFF 305830 TaxID=933852 RepID=A0A0C2W4P2_SERVB|nr:hypothetical protein M408DRAFT_104234 [Serendipita vermifera MAFF 305830]